MEYIIRIARGKRRAGVGESPQYQQYRYVTDNPYATLVQALEYIQSKLDNSLLFRRSCFHGSCGTCGVIVNGKKVLACLVRLAEFPQQELVVDPLAVFPVVGDLAVNPARLYAQLPQGRKYVRRVDDKAAQRASATPAPDAGNPVATARAAGSDAATGAAAANQAVDAPPEQLEHCIECGLCETACPVTAPFLGPAALAAYYRELINRPERREELLERVGAPDGVAPCKLSYECSKVCPAGVYPSGKIVKLRKELE